MRQLIIFSVSFLMFCHPASAETRYVTDDFEIMMRTGPSIKNKIIVSLRSGTRLDILREDAGNGYSQIQTANGDIGYALTRFLSPNQSAKNQIASLRNQLKQLRSKPKELVSLLAASQEDNQALISQNATLTERLSSSDKELKQIKEVSADAVNLAAQNVRLESEVQQLLLQLDDIRIQNEDLRDQSDRMQNILGAGLVLLGVFLGWVLSISGRRGRNTWGS